MNRMNVLKCTAALMICCAMGMGGSVSQPVHSATALFGDVSGHWAESGIRNALELRIVDGYPDGSFRPDASVTRAEFIKMAAQALKLPIGKAGEGADWYKAYVAATEEAGISHSSDFNGGDLNAPISRLEMARIAARSVESGLQVKEYNPEDHLIMYLATKTGLIQGMARGDLALEAATTRAQSVTIIDRILRVKNGEKLEVDKYALANAELAHLKTNIFTVMPDIFGGIQYNKWDTSKMVMETPDGLYKGSVDRIIAIDFEDPNDPNLNLLGDVNELLWWGAGDRFHYVRDNRKSYGIVFERSLEYNKDTSKYGTGHGGPPIMYVSGINAPDDTALSEGVLNTRARLFKPDGTSANAVIIPKDGLSTRRLMSIEIHAPAIPPNRTHAQDIVTVISPFYVK
ncbi:S-layer homology domain-containing protein [Paenibacillus sp. YYML68]|uniref:S-layer homology domain-containing protein n=1 Tax=Paenibacillus sp. YYML68 TaxID=2909250 RepID=UPI0024924660|nr:S-layer homology domain-containing protein [Paenibacillus sp. YYML68]